MTEVATRVKRAEMVIGKLRYIVTKMPDTRQETREQRERAAMAKDADEIKVCCLCGKLLHRVRASDLTKGGAPFPILITCGDTRDCGRDLEVTLRPGAPSVREISRNPKRPGRPVLHDQPLPTHPAHRGH